MFTEEEGVEIERNRKPCRSVFSLRVTDDVDKSLMHYSRNYNFEIYAPIRDFIENRLLPALKKAAQDEDEKLKNNTLVNELP